MNQERHDRELGLHRRISRRDFLNGVAVTAGAAAFGPTELLAAAEYYPPALTGLRGSHVGSFEAAHELRDGQFWDKAGTPTDTGETYDLVIVGGGISGLSAAHFFRKSAGPKARVLILDNHDDFGGHAKRNEFNVGGKFLLGFGGTYSIESPWPYSAVAKGLVEELGIDVPSYSKIVNESVYAGMHPAIFFDKETFGADKLVFDPARGHGSWDKFLSEAPLPEAARRDIQKIYSEKHDYYPGLTSDQKKAKMARISYARFLTEVAGLHPDVVKFFQARPHPLFGLGIDAVSAQDAWGLELPGFEGMNLEPAPGPGMNRDAIRNDEAEKYFFHFPDGNASIARLLVRRLIPGAIPGNTVGDLITARAGYSKLDESSSPVRIRLNSTAMRVRESGGSVQVDYMRGGKLSSVRGSHCILACWNTVIPYICPDLPEAQKKALHFAVKVPIVYTNVAIRNWTSFKKLGVSSVYAPSSYFTEMRPDHPVSLGGYHCSTKPEEPVVVHLAKTPCHPGLPSRDQHRAGRGELFGTTFETFERNIRDQMARTLSAGGFDPARDIAAITVNRWPHGYAYEYNSLWDPFWLNGGEQPCVAARKPFGRIAIANSDAGAYAYTDCAIDQAWRAVHELL
jgi:spermidine dehydrogenase